MLFLDCPKKEDVMLRYVWLLLLCVGCANTAVPIPAPVATVPSAAFSIEILPDECPFSGLRRLNCDEAAVRMDALQAMVDTMRVTAQVEEVVIVGMMPEPILRMHILPLREGDERLLLVTEDFLHLPDLDVEVEQMVCLIAQRNIRSAVPADVRIMQCQYRVAALMRDRERARWIWRVTEPRYRPRLLRGTGPPHFPRCPEGCSIAVDRLA